MALSYGFFDSLSGDRKYNADHIDSIFDGIINDGVFQSIGNAFRVIPGTGLQVLVQDGKAWFNHTWTSNTANFTINLTPANASLKRIDAIVLEVNHNTAVRNNTLKVITGTPAATPSNPTTNSPTDSLCAHHVLAYVTVNAGATSITAANINIRVGQTECPYVSRLVSVTSVAEIERQWTNEFNASHTGWTNQFNSSLAGWQKQFTDWFNGIQTQATEKSVTNLQTQIDTNTRNINAFSSSIPTTYLPKSSKASQAETVAVANNDKYVTPYALATTTPKYLTLFSQPYTIIDAVISGIGNSKTYSKQYAIVDSIFPSSYRTLSKMITVPIKLYPNTDKVAAFILSYNSFTDSDYDVKYTNSYFVTSFNTTSTNISYHQYNVGVTGQQWYNNSNYVRATDISRRLTDGYIYDYNNYNAVKSGNIWNNSENDFYVIPIGYSPSVSNRFLNYSVAVNIYDEYSSAPTVSSMPMWGYGARMYKDGFFFFKDDATNPSETVKYKRRISNDTIAEQNIIVNSGKFDANYAIAFCVWNINNGIMVAARRVKYTMYYLTKITVPSLGSNAITEDCGTIDQSILDYMSAPIYDDGTYLYSLISLGEKCSDTALRFNKESPLTNNYSSCRNSNSNIPNDVLGVGWTIHYCATIGSEVYCVTYRYSTYEENTSFLSIYNISLIKLDLSSLKVEKIELSNNYSHASGLSSNASNVLNSSFILVKSCHKNSSNSFTFAGHTIVSDGQIFIDITTRSVIAISSFVIDKNNSKQYILAMTSGDSDGDAVRRKKTFTIDGYSLSGPIYIDKLVVSSESGTRKTINKLILNSGGSNKTFDKFMVQPG